MTVYVGADGAIELVGICPSEDAEALQHYLLAAAPGAKAVVNWRRCEQAHTAVIQVLLAARPHLIGPAANPFLQNFIAAGLEAPGT
jgi:hypothetical protein